MVNLPGVPMTSSFPPDEAKRYLYKLVEALQLNLNNCDKAEKDTQTAMSAMHDSVSSVRGLISQIHNEINGLEFAKDYVTPEDFSGTNDEKFASAISYCITNNSVLKLTQDYEVNDNLVFEPGSGKRIRLDGNGKVITFPFGKGVHIKNNTTLENLRIKHSTYQDTRILDLTDAGITLHGQYCYLSRVYIENFGTGIYSFGPGEGVQYNYMEYMHCMNCLQGVYFEAGLHISDGEAHKNWVNENALIYSKVSQTSGFKSWASAKTTTDGKVCNTLYAITLKTDMWESVNGTNVFPDVVNCNKFIGCDIEGCFNGAWVCGRYNVFLSVRTEQCEQPYYFALMDYSTTKYCRDNYIIAPYQTLETTADATPVKEEVIYPTNFAGQTRYYNKVFAPGYPMQIGKRVNFDDTSKKNTNISVDSDGTFTFAPKDTEAVKISASAFTFSPGGTEVAKIYAKGVKTKTVSTRPSVNSADVGTMIFDTTLNKPLWVDSSGQWVDASGTVVT